MKSFKLIALCLLLPTMFYAQQSTDHRMGTWTLLPGADAKDVFINNKGDIYMVSTAGQLSSYTGDAWQSAGSEKLKTFSEFKDIVAPSIKLLANGNMLKKQEGYDTKTRMHFVNWNPMSGSDGADLTVTQYFPPGTGTPTNEIIMVNTAGKIYLSGRYVNKEWIQLPGSDATRVSAGKEEVWIVNTVGKLYKLVHATKSNNFKDKWEQMPGANGKDISIGQDGSKWLVTNDGKLHRWYGNGWTEIAGVKDATRVSANMGKVVYIDKNGKMYLNTY